MLDFYLLEDTSPKPGYPEKGGLELVLGLDFETFDALVKCGAIDPETDYYSDFRWRAQLVDEMYDRLSADLKKKPNVARFIEILAKARASKCGLVAYCD